MVSEDLKDKTICVAGLGYVGLPLLASRTQIV
jgi:UDP-N-acetyl-D-mannosaminuronate dehydrogenase